MFQKSATIPEVAIIIKSHQGVGKDLLVNILGEIIGMDLIHKEQRMENCIGNFNEDLENKLIIQFNEVTGSDGHFNREVLKDMITKEQYNINRKYGKKYKCANYSRLLLFTNNLNAIHIPKDDRRYVVLKSGEKQDREYYNKLVSIQKDKDALNSIYSYFMNIDIDDWHPVTNRYISDEYLKLQNHNQNPFYQYIYDELTDTKRESIYGPTNKDLYFMRSRDLNDGYKRYIQDNQFDFIKVDGKKNKLIFEDFPSVRGNATFKIDNKQARGFSFDLEAVLDYLELHHVDAEPDDADIPSFKSKSYII